ncbi:type II toxin-antitoxin system RelE/ParE family toxin [Massilia sp. CCM 8695]|uniref:Type II toxin-antitoxin system RelE/ParE family toxin n=1 Tax=Massilia frigida TaxID=2609281 RepID=A0ABX0NEH5_9BURK|nr:type II toxin-antitoxin system RelE/ParE family toxin [Massilia frigida]NHZ83514.1 type II toxin-antitoxin system RelE/ParE family toxin [Massilia frigida]
MSFRVRYTKEARADLRRLYAYLAAKDLGAARRARTIIAKAMPLLEEFPFTCRKAAADSPRLRELLIDFGGAGYVALFEIEDAHTVTILAVRHQREDDFL